jgi:L-aminopeptidase/D-esterase-like protein
MPDYTRREFATSIAAGMAGSRVLGAREFDVQDAGARTARVGSLTDVPGITVGHVTDTRRPTGCTAILFDQAAAAAADYSSSAPAESMGVLLQLVSPVDRIHAIFFTGGACSASRRRVA